MKRKTAVQGEMSRAAEDLLQQTRRLRRQIVAFSGPARHLAEGLDEILPAGEVALMETPRANICGALEGLLDNDFASALRKLDELDSLLPIFLRARGDSALHDG